MGGGEGPPYWLARLICIKRKESPSYRRGGRAGTALLAGATHLHKTRRENGVDQWPDAGRRPIRNRRPKKKNHKKIASITRGRNPSPPESCAHFFIHFFSNIHYIFFLNPNGGPSITKKPATRPITRPLVEFLFAFYEKVREKKDDNQTGENLKKNDNKKRAAIIGSSRRGGTGIFPSTS